MTSCFSQVTSSYKHQEINRQKTTSSQRCHAQLNNCQLNLMVLYSHVTPTALPAYLPFIYKERHETSKCRFNNLSRIPPSSAAEQLPFTGARLCPSLFYPSLLCSLGDQHPDGWRHRWTLLKTARVSTAKHAWKWQTSLSQFFLKHNIVLGLFWIIWHSNIFPAKLLVIKLLLPRLISKVLHYTADTIYFFTRYQITGNSHSPESYIFVFYFYWSWRRLLIHSLRVTDQLSCYAD